MRALQNVVLCLLLLMALIQRSRAQSSAAPTPLTQVVRVAQMRATHSAFQWFQAHESDLRKWQVEVVSIPAPTHGEAKRAQWMAQRFRNLGLKQVEIDAEGNVTGLLPGSD